MKVIIQGYKIVEDATVEDYTILGATNLKLVNVVGKQLSTGRMEFQEDIYVDFNKIVNSNEIIQIIPGASYPNLTMPFVNFTSDVIGFREIGEVIATITFTTDFSRGTISPAYGTSGFRSGLVNAYKYEGIDLPANKPSVLSQDVETITDYTVLEGIQTWSAKAGYNIGEQPVASDGENYNVPLPAGDTLRKFVNIIGVYPYFATSTLINVLDKHPLADMESEYIEIELATENGTDKQTVQLPTIWKTITGIEQYNPFTQQWEFIGGSKANSLLTFTVTDITKDIQGIEIDYKQYEYNGSTIGARTVRFKTI
jgi:hypothetical protein